MERRAFVAGGLALGGLSAAFLSGCGPSGSKTAGAGPVTLKIIAPQALASLDPVFSTGGATKGYAFLSLDQLVALDANYMPQPQMAEGWTVEDDGRTYLFKLRDGLKWHDGEPVRAQDCIPSIQRWAVRDSFGQIMAKVVDSMVVVDDKSFRIKLTKPFPLLPAALGKTSGPQCFMMPERLAKTPASVQIKESVGSGPFRFLKDEWVSGAKSAWAKFDGYVPRKEPVSGVAGGKIARVDRIEWSTLNDTSTALAALRAGEQDCWTPVPADLVASLKSDPHIVLETRDKAGLYYMMQFNHLNAPFNNKAIRQAIAMAIDQNEFMSAAQPEAAMRHVHPGIYTLGTEFATEEGADLLKTRSIDKAKAALKAAGYNGEKIVLLASQDTPATQSMNLICEDLFRKLGLNIDLQAMDGATMQARRLNQGPVEKGGWSLYLTGWTGNDVLNPAVNPMLRGSGLKGFPGWCTDPELERLRTAWAFASTPAERKDLATKVQVQALQTLPYIPLGAVSTRGAYRDNVTGMFPAPVGAYWNVGKSA